MATKRYRKQPPADAVPVTAIIDASDEEILSPEMKALSQKHRAWARAKLDFVCSDIEATRLAGYEGTPGSLAVQAHRLANNAGILAALAAEEPARWKAETAKTLAVLRHIRDDNNANERDRITASNAILARDPLPKQAAAPKADEAMGDRKYAEWGERFLREAGLPLHHLVDMIGHKLTLRYYPEALQGAPSVETQASKE